MDPENKEKMEKVLTFIDKMNNLSRTLNFSSGDIKVKIYIGNLNQNSSNQYDSEKYHSFSRSPTPRIVSDGIDVSYSQ